MKTEYTYSETRTRSYQGASFDEEECRSHLENEVKDNLLDNEEREAVLNQLKALKEETGFDVSETLLADLETLENKQADMQLFRVGEAYAEIVLEQEFACRFHWNENRDARNPRGNKTGADLVGFIELDGQVLFLFGEVKTSSEIASRPPQVMTNKGGIENQLRDLYQNREKRSILISYIQNKARLFPEGHPFKEDFDAGLRTYYSGEGTCQLVGVLVRDVEPNEKDLSPSFNRLKEEIAEPKGLNLLAIYLPVSKDNWLNVINCIQE